MAKIQVGTVPHKKKRGGTGEWLDCDQIFFFFFLREFQPMASTPDDSSFITKLRHQSVFGVGRDWTLNLLYNH